MRRLSRGLAVALVLAVTCAGAGAAKVRKAPGAPRLANACFALRSAETGQFVGPAGGVYRADQPIGVGFFWKPATLFSYLPSDQDGRLLAVRGDGSIGRAEAPGPATAWSVRHVGKRSVAVSFSADGRQLASSPSGDLTLVAARAGGTARLFTLVRTSGCTPFPEADVSAFGRPRRGQNRKGNVFGFADMHLHITANLRAGGAVLSGEPYDPYGITEALGHDADEHGPDGSDDITGNLLRTGLPFGTHDTHGWPTFAGWPVNDTITHQQTYYVWLKRNWMAGERLVVAQTVEDQSICEI